MPSLTGVFQDESDDGRDGRRNPRTASVRDRTARLHGESPAGWSAAGPADAAEQPRAGGAVEETDAGRSTRTLSSS